MTNCPNCPNCGAPIVSAKCEYCGTVFSGWKPPKGYVSERKHEDEIKLLKAKTICLENVGVLTDLYTSALNAIRSYGSSF